MQISTTTVITGLDLINISNSIAQLNLGYLGISVAILGVFIYFNVRSLKETLDKQEKTILNLKEKADNLLDESKEQSNKTLQDFRKDQYSELLKISQTESLDVKNGMLHMKAEMLKEIKTLVAVDEDLKSKISTLKNNIDELDTEIKEFQVDKYAQNGQQGEIMVIIDLLKKAVNNKNDYDIPKRLNKVDFYIRDNPIRSYIATSLNEVLGKIELDPKYKLLVKRIQDNIKFIEE